MIPTCVNMVGFVWKTHVSLKVARFASNTYDFHSVSFILKYRWRATTVLILVVPTCILPPQNDPCFWQIFRAKTREIKDAIHEELSPTLYVLWDSLFRDTGCPGDIWERSLVKRQTSLFFPISKLAMISVTNSGNTKPPMIADIGDIFQSLFQMIANGRTGNTY